MRHKQAAPKRRQQVSHADDEAFGSQESDLDDQEQLLPPRMLGGVPRPAETSPEYSATSEVTVVTSADQTPVGAIAEFVCATKAAGRPPADAAPLNVLVQLFTAPPCARWLPPPCPVLLFSWRCPGEDEFGPMHEVGFLAARIYSTLSGCCVKWTWQHSNTVVVNALTCGKCF